MQNCSGRSVVFFSVHFIRNSNVKCASLFPVHKTDSDATAHWKTFSQVSEIFKNELTFAYRFCFEEQNDSHVYD